MQLNAALSELQEVVEGGGAVTLADYEARSAGIAALTVESPGVGFGIAAEGGWLGWGGAVSRLGKRVVGLWVAKVLDTSCLRCALQPASSTAPAQPSPSPTP